VKFVMEELGKVIDHSLPFFGREVVEWLAL
jgi:hypothetical protein